MWLYVPNLSPTLNLSTELHCVQALADWKQGFTLQNPNTKLFVTSSGKSSQRAPSWQGWKMRPWITRLSGMMLKPSTADHGVGKFISSLVDTHANRFHSPAGARAQRTRGISGQISKALFGKSSRNGVSSKTSKDISIWEPPTSSTAFEEWVIASKRACSQRVKQGQASGANGYSLWPTPTKSLYCNNLEMALSPGGLKFRDDPSQTGSQISLGSVARVWTLTWLLLKTVGAVPNREYNFTLSHPLHLILRPGLRFSRGDLTFNPSFSGWMMGWPIGWTDPKRPVTGWSVWLLHMRGELSRLPTLPV